MQYYYYYYYHSCNDMQFRLSAMQEKTAGTSMFSSGQSQ